MIHKLLYGTQEGSQPGSDNNGETRSNAAGQPAPTPTHVTHRSSTELQTDAEEGVLSISRSGLRLLPGTWPPY